MKGDAKMRTPLEEINLDNGVAGSPVFANGTLYIASRNTLWAIANPDTAPTATSSVPDDRHRVAGESNRSTAVDAPVDINPASDTGRIVNAAFSPTPHDVVVKMLEVAEIGTDDTVFDLGSGVGRIVITAARKFGCRAVGYERESNLVKLSRERASESGVTDRVTFHQADLFNADLSEADIVTLYLLPIQNERLIPLLNRLPAGARVVSHHFEIPGVKPDKIIEFDSNESGERHRLFLYIAPLNR
jgi:hypothetical protein